MTDKTQAEALRADLIARLKALRGPYLGDGVNPGIHRDELIAALATSAPGAVERAAPASQDEAPSLIEALQPFLRALRINDTDTLSQYRSDDAVLFAASGSWTGSASITMGDLRRLGEASLSATSAASANETLERHAFTETLSHGGRTFVPYHEVLNALRRTAPHLEAAQPVSATSEALGEPWGWHVEYPVGAASYVHVKANELDALELKRKYPNVVVTPLYPPTALAAQAPQEAAQGQAVLEPRQNAAVLRAALEAADLAMAEGGLLACHATRKQIAQALSSTAPQNTAHPAQPSEREAELQARLNAALDDAKGWQEQMARDLDKLLAVAAERDALQAKLAAQPSEEQEREAFEAAWNRRPKHGAGTPVEGAREKALVELGWRLARATRSGEGAV